MAENHLTVVNFSEYSPSWSSQPNWPKQTPAQGDTSMAKRKVATDRTKATGVDRAGGEQEAHVWYYDELVKLTGKTRNTIYQHVRRGSFNPDDLGSVVAWVARHGTPAIKRAILDYALEPPGVNPLTSRKQGP